jgi:hypothetical protein
MPHGIGMEWKILVPRMILIGVAMRYMSPFFSASLHNNWFLTPLGILSIVKDYGMNTFLSNSENFQQSLERSRNIQANRFQANHPGEEEKRH